MRFRNSPTARAAWSRTARLALAAAGVFALGWWAALPSMAISSRDRNVQMSMIDLEGSAGLGGIAVANAPDATIWFAATRRSAIGEIDVGSGAIGYISLGHGAMPRGLARCPNGRLYALDAALGVIHEIEPRTDMVTRLPMPDGQTLELGSAVCTPDNQLVFTAYNGAIGLLDTASHRITLTDAIGGRGAAAVTLGSAGQVWVASYAANLVIRFNPVSRRQESFPMPRATAGPKAMLVDGQGRLWVTAHRSGGIARLDPARRAWESWALAEGARPFGIALGPRGSILFTDSGRDRLMRVDQTTGFVSELAVLPSKSQARDIRVLDNRAYVSVTGADRIAVVRFGPPLIN